jgi:hypothetical protein
MPSWINPGKLTKAGESTAVGGICVADLGHCVRRINLSSRASFVSSEARLPPRVAF